MKHRILKSCMSLLIAVVAFTAYGCASGTFFNDASATLGVTDTLGSSVFCAQRFGDGEYTSSAGLKGNLYQSSDERLRVNANYNYYNCLWRSDDKVAETAGLELEYKFFVRK